MSASNDEILRILQYSGKTRMKDEILFKTHLMQKIADFIKTEEPDPTLLIEALTDILNFTIAIHAKSPASQRIVQTTIAAKILHNKTTMEDVNEEFANLVKAGVIKDHEP